MNDGIQDDLDMIEPVDFGTSDKGEELAEQLIILAGTGEYSPTELAQAIAVLMAVHLVTAHDDSAPNADFMASGMGMLQGALLLTENTEWADQIRKRTRTVARIEPGVC